MNKLIHKESDNTVSYKNGNYTVTINLDNGTKVRETDEDEFIPEFAESIDITISDRCNRGCKYCYLACTPDGEQPDLLKWNFLDTLHPYTEVAINMNFPAHPQIVPFLEKIRDMKVIANVTVNQMDFIEYHAFFDCLIKNKLIHGVGISLVEPTEDFIQTVKEFPNTVIHVIAGVVTEQQLHKMKDKGLKLLILGYKESGRGREWFEHNWTSVYSRRQWLAEHINKMKNWFDVISFDCSALEQLKVRYYVGEEKFNKFYLGRDGEFTFAIDLINGVYKQSSHSPLGFKIGKKSVDEMFNVIKDVQVRM